MTIEISADSATIIKTPMGISVELNGVSTDDVLGQLDTKEVIGSYSAKDIANYGDTNDILDEIGEEYIKKYFNLVDKEIE